MFVGHSFGKVELLLILSVTYLSVEEGNMKDFTCISPIKLYAKMFYTTRLITR